jgi:hypothetical protein
MRLTQCIFYRLAALILGSLSGLLLLTSIHYLQLGPNGGDFPGLIILVCIYFFPGILLATYFSQKLSVKFKIFTILKHFYISSLGLFLTLSFSLLLLLVPINEFNENDFFLGFSFVLSYSFSMVLYYWLVNLNIMANKPDSSKSDG